MTTDWNACFQAVYTSDQVADAARQVLSRAAEMTNEPEKLLLMDLISEVACKLRMDGKLGEGIDIQVTSPGGNFDPVSLQNTGQFSAYVTALKTGAIDTQTDQKLALQSAAANVLEQATSQGHDLSGVAITTTPLGFENFIKQSQPKSGLLARIMGKLK